MDNLQRFNKYVEFLPISKAQRDAQEVTGIVLYAEKVDLQDEIYSSEVIKASMMDYMEYYRHMGEMHKKLAKAVPFESFQMPSGDWYITAKVKDDKVWDKIDKGVYTGFSIGGRARGHMISDSVKRLDLIITEEISFVDKAANGGVYSIVKRFDEGGVKSMEKEMKEALEKSRKAAEEAENLTKRLDMVDKELQEVSKSLEKTDETLKKVDDWDAAIKSLKDQLTEKTETKEPDESVNKRFTDLLGAMQDIAKKIDSMEKRFEQPVYKGEVDLTKNIRRDTSNDPAIDLALKSIEFWSNKDQVNKAVSGGMDIVAEGKKQIRAILGE